MARQKPNPLKSLLDSPRVREAARALIEAVHAETESRELAPKAYDRAVRELERMRGRPLFHPALASALGRGARVRLANGNTLIDFASGIGTYGFGHSDLALLESAVVAAAGDSVFQGHLLPGIEVHRLSKALLRHAGPHLKHVWLSLSGAVANENALKMIYQRHAPAEKIVAFERAFAGRTLAMAEITDKPAYRQGLPARDTTLYVPFFDPEDPESLHKSLAALDAHLARYPNRIAGMLFELIQGEGGFHTAPTEFFAALMNRCRDAGIAVWVDEVQTFARTGELFAFKTLGLEELVDLVTAGKTLQGSAVLFRKDYNPKPGLVAGTFAGSTVGMAVGALIIERLEGEGFLGPDGRIAVLGRRVDRRLDSLRKRMPRAVGPRSGMGAMQAFVPFDGAADVVSDVMKAAFEQGLLIHSAGADPTKLRFLLPVNTTDEELESGFAMLEKAMRRVAEARDLPC
jgi:acetylornithine/N-succinyldiaminopimelate aminotransferase